MRRDGRNFVGRRGAVAAGAAMLLVAALVGPAALPAGAAATGSITGIVTASSGAPLAHVCVSAHRIDVDSTRLKITTTAANGRYKLANLPVGKVHVQFSDAGFCPGGVAGNFVGKWFNNQPSLNTATPVAVAKGVTKANINAVLPAGGSITGTVIRAPSGARLQHICVGAFLPGVEPILVASASTAANGTYRLTGVPARPVLVEFFATGVCPGGVALNFVGQWFNGQPSLASAQPVNVTARATRPGINAALTAGGTISGLVVGAGVHRAGLSGICVAAFSSGVNPALVASVATSSNGRYTLKGVPAGSVRVQFNSSGACPGGIVGHLILQWFDNKPSFDTADPVTVVASVNTTNVNAALVPG